MTLRAARVNSGFTIKEVAEKTDKCFDTISKYEDDSTSIPQDLLVQLLQIYKIPFPYIFFGKESEFHGFEKAIRRKRTS
ncbi:hypothetical protein A7975_27245 [Bacillus sp. FJAT-26390]|nr:hypothetical protein A7975_27245 [Bacillus sp. FJAT-26390]